jgi:hypothetical protein
MYSPRSSSAKIPLLRLLLFFLCVAGSISLVRAAAFSQQRTAGQEVKPPARAPTPNAPKAQEPAASQSEPAPAEDDQAVLPGDWGPELLYNIISSPNEDAHDALYRAAFAAGSSIVAQLEAALKDDRTAEFAAQVLAYMGGPKAFEILTRLVNDPRDLNLRRFYYGALGEFPVPDATSILFSAIERADVEPDRTVTEAAILAVTVQSDANLVPKLRNAEANIQDPVIRDDLDNAAAVIQDRARYLASPAGRDVEGSLQQAVRIYFVPALETAGLESSSSPAAPSSAPGKKLPVRVPSHESYANPVDRPARDSIRPAHPPEPKPAVHIDIRNLTFSPEKTRALARVAFEDSSAVAYYDMVLQKRSGNWTLASVWLGSQMEKARTNQVNSRKPRQPRK